MIVLSYGLRAQPEREPPFWIVSTAVHCGRSVAHNRVICVQLGLELSAYSRGLSMLKPLPLGSSMITQSTSPSPAAMTLAPIASRRLISALLVAVYGRGQGEVRAVLQLMTLGNTLKQQARPAVGRHDLACLVRRMRWEHDDLVVIALAGDLPAEDLCPPLALNPRVMTVHDYGVPAQAHIRKLTDARALRYGIPASTATQEAPKCTALPLSQVYFGLVDGVRL